MFNDPVGFGGAGFMFTLVPILMVIGFVVVIFGIVKNAAGYARNAGSPKESVYARVVAKRMDVRTHGTGHNHHHGETGGAHHHHGVSSRTYYYITLEFDSMERKEFLDVKGLYGLVAEGDAGYAAIQGDWIIAFERSAPQPARL